MKTTVVKGVLTSYELMLAILFRLVIVAVIVITSLFVFNYFHPWKSSLPSVFMHVLLCPLGMKGTSPHLLWQSH